MRGVWTRFRRHLHRPHRRPQRVVVRDTGDVIGYTTSTDGGDW